MIDEYDINNVDDINNISLMYMSRLNLIKQLTNEINDIYKNGDLSYLFFVSHKNEYKNILGK